jgi:hypothetical protein
MAHSLQKFGTNHIDGDNIHLHQHFSSQLVDCL